VKYTPPVAGSRNDDISIGVGDTLAPPDNATTTEYTAKPEDAKWLSLCDSAFRDSTEWLEANVRNQWERNYALFRNEHPTGSKYHSDEYKHRAKGFRPKIRAAIRSNEAAAQSAFFSTNDVADVTAENEKDDVQMASAAINKELLNYRLKKTLPWIQLTLGAFQEAQVNGATVGAVEWKYREKTIDSSYEAQLDDNGEPVLDENGLETFAEVKRMEILEDKPEARLVPLENLRIDPAADWTDPINSSPYLIELMPMFIVDVLERMESIDPKTGEPDWRKLSIDQIQGAESHDYDTTRMAREGDRQDPKVDRSRAVSMYNTVWVRKVIVKYGGEDMLYYTLGSEYLLSDPKPLKEVYLHNMRPYVMGCVILEAFRVYVSGMVELGQGLQSSANDLSNQRRDNVNLALNKRYHIQRGKNVDLNALMRNVPGGGVLMDDLESVEVVHTPDVTSSSYQEQDRINVDFDEIMGQFSQSSVQTNRSMNETVGGLQLVSSGANQMTEYLIKIFAITWYQPMIYQMVALEQAYETDEVLLALAGENSKIYQKYGINEITDELLRQNLTITVNVGMDATDPIKRIEKLSYALDAIAKALGLPGMNKMEVIKEVLGAVGYSDPARFFMDLDEEQDPRLAEYEQVIQELQNVIATDQHKIQAKGEADIALENSKSEAARILEEVKGAQQAALLDKKQEGEVRKSELSLDAQIQIARENNDSVAEREIDKYEHELEKLREELENKLEELATEHDNDMIELEKKGEIDSAQTSAERKHDKEKVVYLEQRKSLEGSDEGKSEQENDQHDVLLEKLEALTAEVQALKDDDSASQVDEIRQMLDKIVKYQNAPRSIKKDADGNPISIEVKGFDSIPVGGS